MGSRLQIEFNYELVHRFNLRTAYKYYDIQTDYQYVTQDRPLQAKPIQKLVVERNSNPQLNLLQVQIKILT